MRPRRAGEIQIFLRSAASLKNPPPHSAQLILQPVVSARRRPCPALPGHDRRERGIHGTKKNPVECRFRSMSPTIPECGRPTHKQKGIYSLTEQGIELLPILAQMAAWGYKYLPVTEELGIRAELLSDGGPTMWAELMDELREIHLGLKPKRRTGPSVGERLQAAYEKVMAKARG